MTPGGLLDAWGVSPASKQNITRQVTSAFTESGFASESNPHHGTQTPKLLQNIGNALDLFLADRKHSREIMRLLREEALAVFPTRDKSVPPSGKRGLDLTCPKGDVERT